MVEKLTSRCCLSKNAGQGSSAVPVEDVPLSTFDLVMSVDVRAAFMITQEAVRQMKSQIPQGGRIISSSCAPDASRSHHRSRPLHLFPTDNGSISAHVPRVQSTPYTMAKHAISGLTKCTQLDGRKFNIACSQVDVGNATTNMGGKGDPRVSSHFRVSSCHLSRHYLLFFAFSETSIRPSPRRTILSCFRRRRRDRLHHFSPVDYKHVSNVIIHFPVTLE